MMQAGAAVFGINISVGISMGIAGARMSTAAGILKELPHDCMAVVGIQELEVHLNNTTPPPEIFSNSFLENESISPAWLLQSWPVMFLCVCKAAWQLWAPRSWKC